MNQYAFMATGCRIRDPKSTTPPSHPRPSIPWSTIQIPWAERVSLRSIWAVQPRANDSLSQRPSLTWCSSQAAYSTGAVAAMAGTPVLRTSSPNTNPKVNNYSRALDERDKGNLPVVWALWSPVYDEVWCHGDSSTLARNQQQFSWLIVPRRPQIGAGWLSHLLRPPVTQNRWSRREDRLAAILSAYSDGGGQSRSSTRPAMVTSALCTRRWSSLA
jgi:hypothetical protein